MKRYCEPYIIQDLASKMVFIGGPRQVGKTTLAKCIMKDAFDSGLYLNWDSDVSRRRIMSHEWENSTNIIVFDELHKYPRWKQWIKGVYDERPKKQNYLVTGSARLDVYRKGGDSLMGRYHYWRLHPFTIDELPPKTSKAEGFERLMNIGGFPEPFLAGDERLARRWRTERFDRIINEDVRDLENVQNLQLLHLFIDMLRERAGGLIAISNIAKDLQVSPSTTKAWLALVERMYIAFPIYPLIKNIPRSILKPAKVFFYDNADTKEDVGVRFENLVATTLLKRLNFISDYHGFKTSLHYIRDKDGREVDFVTVIDGKVEDLIEVKYSDDQISSSLKYYAKKLKAKRAVQLVYKLKHSYDKDGVLVTSPIKFFNDPPWSEK